MIGTAVVFKAITYFFGILKKLLLYIIKAAHAWTHTKGEKIYIKSDNLLVRYKSMQFIEILKDVKPLEEFDMDIFFSIIEKITVFEGEKIIVTLLDGTEIECEIE